MPDQRDKVSTNAPSPVQCRTMKELVNRLKGITFKTTRKFSSGAYSEQLQIIHIKLARSVGGSDHTVCVSFDSLLYTTGEKGTHMSSCINSQTNVWLAKGREKNWRSVERALFHFSCGKDSTLELVSKSQMDFIMTTYNQRASLIAAHIRAS